MDSKINHANPVTTLLAAAITAVTVGASTYFLKFSSPSWSAGASSQFQFMRVTKSHSENMESIKRTHEIFQSVLENSRPERQARMMEQFRQDSIFDDEQHAMFERIAQHNFETEYDDFKFGDVPQVKAK